MSVTLYGAPLSPFVRKVRLALAEKGMEYQLHIIAPGAQPDWYYDISPLGRIPALQDGDVRLADSSVITQYLEEQYPTTPALYGNSAAERARIRWLEKYADYELAPHTTFCIFLNRALNPTRHLACDEAAVQRALTEKLPAHFDYLERTLGAAEWFVGKQISMADLAVATQLISMQHGGESLDASRWPQLADLLTRVCARAGVQNTLPDECALLQKLLAKAQATASH